ncbi:hypothetical protein [Enterobacter sp. BIDMC109]|uniref:hypothetical protein n=1 Tax=Enterobacter sp. BIDMC109 TaxID=1686400 RepID=UPI000658E8D3|nr:hypothetical protein [Enterobacter sp. BIDMC109]KLW82728.1 hypothetical protein SK62_01561 [Enterobacter sp. BIDMC109]
MITFTKEQLIASAHARIEFAEMMLAGELEPLKERTWSIELELARIALASLEADSKLSNFIATQESLGVAFERVLAENIEELYVPSKSTPPALVSDSLLSELLAIAKKAADAADECAHAEWSDDSMEHSTAIADWERRASMLQGDEPVTTAYKLPDEFDFDRFNDVVWLEAVASNPHMHSPTTSTIAMVALELNRKLADGNSPVIPDGWVILPAEPTQAMMNAWLSEVANWHGHAAGYRAMIAAAPQQEAKNV